MLFLIYLISMKEGKLTFDEASDLCHEYAELVGQPFCGEYRNLGNIEAVVVSPFGKLDKFYFLKQYQTFGDPVTALAFYTGEDFDVVLIGHDLLNQVTCRELSAHLAYNLSNPELQTKLD